MSQAVRRERSMDPVRFGAICGIVGAIFLVVYFSAPISVPSASATAAQIATFAHQQRSGILLGAWLQAVGSFLGIVFYLSLVYAADGLTRLAGWVTIVASTLLLTLSVVEGVCFMDVAYATSNGHALTALSSFDLQTVFVHAFLTVAAPAVYAGLGVLLLGSSVLPRAFAYIALILAVAFEGLGFVGLFVNAANTVAIAPLVGQALWILAAGISLLRTRPLESSSTSTDQRARVVAS